MDLIQIEKPTLPDSWDYDESVNKVKQQIYKWKNLTEEIVIELHIANKILTNRKRASNGTFVTMDKTWAQYCEEIDSSKQVIDRWLKQWFPAQDTIASKWTGDPEGYTPEKYIESARQVMGSIDVDPASNAFANQIVKATIYYTEKNNGLDKPWKGNVFLNPPYKQPEIRFFVDKLIAEIQSKRTKQAILLTNNNTDTQWFANAAKVSTLMCFTLGRIDFYKPDNTITQPTNGQAFFYFGNNLPRFAQEFSKYGLIYTLYHLSSD